MTQSRPFSVKLELPDGLQHDCSLSCFTAGLFYPAFGLLLRPEITALSMAGSSLLVALNALMLKRTRLPGIRARRPGEQVAAHETTAVAEA